MLHIPEKNPKPDFNTFVDVLNGVKIPDRVFIAELLIDEEIKERILAEYFDEGNCSPPILQWKGMSREAVDGEKRKEAYERYYRQIIHFYYRMGYSVFADLTYIINFEALNTHILKTKDASPLSNKERAWAVEGTGLVQSWEDFEKFPWEKANFLLSEYEGYLEYIRTILPDGMKIAAVASMFEEVLEWILGYVGFFYMIFDNTDLVDAVFQKVGEIIFHFFKKVVSYDVIGCLWLADDLGYKSAPMISPDLLDKWVFPWYKKYASLAHSYGKPFYLHSCGNKDKIMDTLIEEVQIDAIHAFEDNSSPVTEYKRKWGRKIGIIGGVDVDKLARYTENDLRNYLRSVLEICMERGKYIFGSGNSICNYIPVENYLLMLDEAKKWGEL